MTSRVLKVLSVALIALAFLAYAQERYEPEFYCDAQDRLLSDADFVQLALAYELEKRDSGYRHDNALPEGYQIVSGDKFLKKNPSSYNIVRDPKNMRNQSKSWLARFEDWLDGEQIAIWLIIPSDTIGEPKLLLAYFTNECGEMNRDRHYRISKHHITE